MNYPLIIADVTVNLSDLLEALLILAGIAALTGLTIFFIKLAKLLSALGATVEKISPDIEDSVKKLPATIDGVNGIVEKLDQSMSDVNKISSEAGEAVPAVLNDVTQVSGIVGDTAVFLRAGVNKIGEQGLNLINRKSSSSDSPSKMREAAKLVGMVLSVYKGIKGLGEQIPKDNKLLAVKKKKKKKRKGLIAGK